MESNLPEPEPAASEPPVTAPVPPMIAPEPPVTVPVPPVTVSPTEVPLGSVATGLESGYVTPVPKGISKPRTSGEQQNGEFRFAPVTAAGISAFFAAMRRPNTQVSFTTQGSQDMEITQQPAPEESQDVAAAPTQEIAPEVAPATEVPIPPAASTPTPTVVGATPKPDDETVVGTTPKPDETVVGTTYLNTWWDCCGDWSWSVCCWSHRPSRDYASWYHTSTCSIDWNYPKWFSRCTEQFGKQNSICSRCCDRWCWGRADQKTTKSPIHAVLQVSQGTELPRHHQEEIPGSPIMFPNGIPSQNPSLVWGV